MPVSHSGKAGRYAPLAQQVAESPMPKQEKGKTGEVPKSAASRTASMLRPFPPLSQVLEYTWESIDNTVGNADTRRLVPDPIHRACIERVLGFGLCVPRRGSLDSNGAKEKERSSSVRSLSTHVEGRSIATLRVREHRKKHLNCEKMGSETVVDSSHPRQIQIDLAAVSVIVGETNIDNVHKGDRMPIHPADWNQSVGANADVYEGTEVGAALHFAPTGVGHQRRYDFDVDDRVLDYDFYVFNERYADSLFSRQ
ncbi:hypothetical protein MRX96_047321 [Rhipicephalus microplus]